MLDDRTWLLIARKMANEATPQELRELEDILKVTPELHFSLQTLSGLWHQRQHENIHDLESAYTAVLNRMEQNGTDAPVRTSHELMETSPVFDQKEGPSLRRVGVPMLLLTATFLVAAWLFVPSRRPAPNPGSAENAVNEISTKHGSKTNILLPDGSRVWLNAGSKITYDKEFGENSRNVHLSGEAYFDVVHNASSPFVIHTKAMDIRVLGTEFNVKSYPDEKTTETSLIRGSIEVTLKDKRAEKILLKPNEKLVVNHDVTTDSAGVMKRKALKRPEMPIISLGSLHYFSVDSTILETSWVDNRLVFEDESFGDIALKMERWYGVTFVFQHEEVRNMRFTGNFRDENLIDALEAMQITADFNFTLTDNTVTITKR